MKSNLAAFANLFFQLIQEIFSMIQQSVRYSQHSVRKRKFFHSAVHSILLHWLSNSGDSSMAILLLRWGNQSRRYSVQKILSIWFCLTAFWSHRVLTNKVCACTPWSISFYLGQISTRRWHHSRCAQFHGNKWISRCHRCYRRWFHCVRKTNGIQF